MEKPVDTEKLINYLIGQVIKTLKADPRHKGKCVEPTTIRKILEELIDEEIKKRNLNTPVDTNQGGQV